MHHKYETVRSLERLLGWGVKQGALRNQDLDNNLDVPPLRTIQLIQEHSRPQ